MLTDREKAKQGLNLELAIRSILRGTTMGQELQKLLEEKEEKDYQEWLKSKEYQLQNKKPPIMETKPNKQTKPDWITDEQWRINPNVYHWERSRKAMRSNELSKKSPMSMEKAREQMVKRYESLGLCRKDYEDSLK